MTKEGAGEGRAKISDGKEIDITTFITPQSLHIYGMEESARGHWVGRMSTARKSKSTSYRNSPETLHIKKLWA